MKSDQAANKGNEPSWASHEAPQRHRSREATDPQQAFADNDPGDEHIERSNN